MSTAPHSMHDKITQNETPDTTLPQLKQYS
jgi:hypothetical protein